MSQRVFRSAVSLVAAAGLAFAVLAAQPEVKKDEKPASQPASQPGGPRSGSGQRPGGPDGRGPGGQGGGGSLGGSMKSMNRSLKALSAQVADASKREDNLKLIGDAERACINAKSMQPAGDAYDNAKDDAAKAKAKELFRADLMVLIRRMLDVEQAIIDGKTDVAKTGVEDLLKMREKGHKDMGVEEDEK